MQQARIRQQQSSIYHSTGLALPLRIEPKLSGHLAPASYQPGLLPSPQVNPIPSGNLPPGSYLPGLLPSPRVKPIPSGNPPPNFYQPCPLPFPPRNEIQSTCLRPAFDQPGIVPAPRIGMKSGNLPHFYQPCLLPFPRRNAIQSTCMAPAFHQPGILPTPHTGLNPSGNLPPGFDQAGFLPSPQIEPIPSGNLHPGFDSSACCTVYVGNIHSQVTKPFLQENFAITGAVRECRLIRKEGESTFGFVHYFEHRSAARAVSTLNAKQLFGQAIIVNWAYERWLRGPFTIFVGDLSPEVTDATLFACFSVFPSCSAARVVWDQKTGHSKLYGFVSFSNQQDAQRAINDFTGKWLGSRPIRCNWATKGPGANDKLCPSDARNVMEFTSGTSEDGQDCK